MNIYDKKFVHFEWDDMLEGKRCVVSDLVSDIRRYVNSTTDTLALLEVKNSGDHNYPFSTGTNCHLFCYYDPLYEYKLAYNAGKKVQIMRDGEVWEDTSTVIEVEGDFDWDDEYEYRIVEEKAKSERLTNRQLAKWIAQGKGEIAYEKQIYTNTNFVYCKNVGDEPVSDNVVVRKWEDTEWHEPTVDYCFPEA